MAASSVILGGPPLLAGFLEKKGSGDGRFGRRNWKRRWFVLADNVLYYWKSLDEQRTEQHPRCIIPLEGCEAAACPGHGGCAFAVAVPDGRLQDLDDIVHGQRVVPATVEFVDIAGLVKGASMSIA